MIYLDHNSTTKMKKEASEDIFAKLDGYALNPSSIHGFGREARKMLEDARNRIANNLGISLGRGAYKIIFTSGGTESNNLVIKNFTNDYILYSAVEHASVKDVVEKISDKAIKIPVNKNGIIDLDFLDKTLEKTHNERLKNNTEKEDNTKILVSVMTANNETGVLQPVEEISKIAHKHGAYLHTDAVQALGKIDFNLKNIDADYVSLSAHKIGGLVGSGVLIAKDSHQLEAQISGGGQEKGERSGTENVLGAMSFAKALELSINNLQKYTQKVRMLKEFLDKEVEKINGAEIIAQKSHRLPNTTMLALKNISSDMQLIQFDLAGIAVSNGSACSSGKVKSSHVLEAMGYEKDIANSAIRVSLSSDNTIDDVKSFISVFKNIAKSKYNDNADIIDYQKHIA